MKRAAVVCMMVTPIWLANAQTPQAPLTLGEPLAILGKPGGPLELTAIGLSFAMADGRLAVAQPRDTVVLLFDAMGKLLKRIGRGGHGPNEFSSISTIGMVGDSMYIYDRTGGAGRVNVYSRTWEFGSTHALPIVKTPPDALPGVAQGLFRDGTMIMTGVSIPVANSGTLQGPIPPPRTGGTLVVATADGKSARAIAHFQPSTFSTALRVGRRNMSNGTYAPNILIRPAPDGQHVLLAQMAPPRSAGPQSYPLSLITSAGDTVWTRRIPFTPVPIPAQYFADLEANLKSNVQGAGDGNESRLVAQYVAQLPRFNSPLMDGFVGVDRSVWLAERTTNEKDYDWRVLDARGRDVMRIRIPIAKRPMAATSAFVWLAERDTDDIPFIARYAVPKR